MHAIHQDRPILVSDMRNSSLCCDARPFVTSMFALRSVVRVNVLIGQVLGMVIHCVVTLFGLSLAMTFRTVAMALGGEW